MRQFNKIEWTDEQRKFLNLNKKGKFVVKACPGSGKSTAVTERVYRFIKNWNNKKSGIAVLSFTNVAADEIKENYEKELNLKIEYPHFVGTLDSFINTYIFLPYGKLVMGCKEKPVLVGEPNSYWSSRDYLRNQFEQVNFLIDGEVKNRYSINRSYAEIKKMKYDLTKEGFATQKDAIYHSMKVLEEYPQIAKALSLRFPHMIIDEAQDTSDITMRIIDLLIENGLDNVILVGDPEQAIYEWNGANPKLFYEKYAKWDESIDFTYNFRSSQQICDFFSKLSDIDEITSKCLHDFDLKPVIIPHTLNFKEIMRVFFNDCHKNNIKINNEDVCVLFRGNEEIFNFKKSFKLRNVYKLFDYNCILKNRTVNIIEGIYHWNNGEYLKGFEIMQREYLKHKFNSSRVTYEDISEEINHIGFQKHRANVFNFIESFPKIENNQTIDSWINLVNYNPSINFSLCEVKNENVKNIPYHAKEITFELLFNDDEKLDYHIGTVHSVKGCSLEATLLILKNQTQDRMSYREVLHDDISLINNEELRIVYVALSRPKKLLYLAVPENDYGMWKSLFS